MLSYKNGAMFLSGLLMVTMLVAVAGCSKDDAARDGRGGEEKSAVGKEETSADEKSTLVGLWKAQDEHDDQDNDVFPPFIELCADGTIKGPEGTEPPGGINSSWTAKDGRLTISAKYPIGEEEASFAFECDYTLSGSTLTLSNGRVAETVNGKTHSETNDQSVTYKKK